MRLIASVAAILMAPFAALSYNVVFKTANPFDGKVKGPDGIAVESYTCQVPSGGSSPVITASPVNGCRLVCWSGSLSSKNLSIQATNVQSDIVAYANFCALNKWRVSFSCGNGGSLEGALIQYVSDLGDCTSVLASPNDGYDFSGWSGGSTSMENPLLLKYVSSDLDVFAIFTPSIYHTISFTAGEGGELSGNTSQRVKDKGASTEVEAIPASGFVFEGWRGDVESSDNPIVLYNVQKDIAITAYFNESSEPKEDYSIFRAKSISVSITSNKATFKVSAKSKSIPSGPASLDGISLKIDKAAAAAGCYNFSLSSSVNDALCAMKADETCLSMAVGGLFYKSVDKLQKENCSWKCSSNGLSFAAKRTFNSNNRKFYFNLSAPNSILPINSYSLKFPDMDPVLLSECSISFSGSRSRVKFSCGGERAKLFPILQEIPCIITLKDGSEKSLVIKCSLTRTATFAKY